MGHSYFTKSNLKYPLRNYEMQLRTLNPLSTFYANVLLITILIRLGFRKKKALQRLA